MSTYGGLNAYGSREKLSDGTRGDFLWKTYSEVGVIVKKVAAGLDALGITPDTPVGIWSINREEWVYSFFAIIRIGGFCVPLYDTLGANAVSFILEDANVSTVFVSKENLPKVLKVYLLPHSSNIVVIKSRRAANIENSDLSG